MSTIERHPIRPPTGPPNRLPPPFQPPPNYDPLAGLHPAPNQLGGGHGIILGVGTPKAHKPVYRVGETATGQAPSTTDHAPDVLAALQAFLAAHQGAVAAGGETPAMPSTFTVTATAEPANGGTGAVPPTQIPVDQPPPHPPTTPPPLFKPGNVPPHTMPPARGVY